MEVLPPVEANRKSALVAIQVTTRSAMGAIIYETGGILVDHGWIRILGSGCERLPRSLPEWNKGRTFDEYGDSAPYLLVADDVIGGFFASDGGGLGGKVGSMFYFAPDSLRWEPIDMGYSDFVYWCFTGDTASGGHCYLGATPPGDAVVVVSKGEYDDGWWERHGNPQLPPRSKNARATTKPTGALPTTCSTGITKPLRLLRWGVLSTLCRCSLSIKESRCPNRVDQLAAILA